MMNESCTKMCVDKCDLFETISLWNKFQVHLKSPLAQKNNILKWLLFQALLIQCC